MRLLKTYLGILALVLAINLATNWGAYKSGAENWRLSLLYSSITATIGFLIFVTLDRLYLKRLLNWKLKPELSFLIFIGVCGVTGAALEALGHHIKTSYLHHPPYSGKDYFEDLVFTAILFIMLALTTTFRTFIDRWKESLNETARVEQLLLKTQFESLKNQVNPHFLFNALNTLTSLIRENEDQAVDFVQQLSRILRYSLEKQEDYTTSLQNELKIARAYLQIFKQRYGDKMNYTIDIPPELGSKQLVCHSLIMLLENAIKHNEISYENPLTIDMHVDGTYLIVENNLQPKRLAEPSSRIGLANIRQQYALVSSSQVITETTAAKWIVKLPIL